jgi:hypothetical protein
MTDIINKLYFERQSIDASGFQMAKKMIFSDGFEMSVQASSIHYSTPRQDGCRHYAEFEVGFPTEREELLMPYIDGDESTDPTQTVYGHVPADILSQIVEKHGGAV